MQGAAGLFIAVLGFLVMLAAPPSLRGLLDRDAAPVAEKVQPAPASSASEYRASAEWKQARFEAAPSMGSFHSAEEAVSPGSVSHGALGMLLLASFSLLLLLWAFVLRTRQARQEER